MGRGCAQWDGLECGLIDRLVEDYRDQLGEPEVPDPLPECPIRTECRWFRQRGPVACAVCSYVVTDLARPEADLPREVVRRREKYAAEAAR
jgi:hypothetical protein